jgi:hypothetical protein
LVDDDQKLSEATRKELASAVLEETDRLDRQVRNLLDMTRLESGGVQIKKEWQFLQEVVGAAFNRIESRFGGRAVTIRVPADILAPFDGVLIEQVMVNLLENAAKYTPEGTPIEVEATKANGEVIVEVADRGDGHRRGGAGAHLRQVPPWALRTHEGRRRARAHDLPRHRHCPRRPHLGRQSRRRRGFLQVHASRRRTAALSRQAARDRREGIMTCRARSF